jgi:hypothetical protein
MSTSFNPSSTYNFKSNYEYEQEEEEEDRSIDDETAPYLSNFAKRLSTLKAEPIDAGLSQRYKNLREDHQPSTSYGVSSSRYSTQTYQKPLGRGSVVKGVAREFESIDKKYSIRRYAYIAMIVMIIIAIYVLIFM